MFYIKDMKVSEEYLKCIIILHKFSHCSLLCILFSITVLMEIAPGPLLKKPSLLFSDNLPNVLQYTRDVYVNHVCIIHKSLSPCECEELSIELLEICFANTFDPLELQKPSPVK